MAIRTGASPPNVIRTSSSEGKHEDTLPRKGVVIDLQAISPVPCPCGTARRALMDRDEFPGTIHLTQISRNAREHYHQEHTEVYVVLQCGEDASIELDGVKHSLLPQSAVLIPPGVRHRACGEMTVLIVCTPDFDPSDEHFD